MVGGQKQWGCASLPLISGAPNPINMLYFPLFCDTVSIMNLMCRYSPFGECTAVGMSSNTTASSLIGQFAPFSRNANDTTVARLLLGHAMSFETSRGLPTRSYTLSFGD